MGSGVSRLVTGSYLGTGSLQNIIGEKLGFKPKRLTIHRRTSQLDMVKWLDTLADDSGYIHPGTGGAVSLATSQMVTPLADGFSVGTNAAVNNSGDTYDFEAEE